MVTYIHIMAPKCALSLGPKSATSLVIFTHLVKRGLSEPQMLSFEHILDPRNKCGYLTHAIKRDIDISVTTSCSLSNVSPAMLARSSSPNQAARSEFVRSQGVSAIPSPSRTGSAFSSFEHQARFITVTLPRLLNPHKVFFTITHFVSNYTMVYFLLRNIRGSRCAIYFDSRASTELYISTFGDLQRP